MRPVAAGGSFCLPKKTSEPWTQMTEDDSPEFRTGSGCLAIGGTGVFLQKKLNKKPNSR
jgi:hypothetical protein